MEQNNEKTNYESGLPFSAITDDFRISDLIERKEKTIEIGGEEIPVIEFNPNLGKQNHVFGWEPMGVGLDLPHAYLDEFVIERQGTLYKGNDSNGKRVAIIGSGIGIGKTVLADTIMRTMSEKGVSTIIVKNENHFDNEERYEKLFNLESLLRGPSTLQLTPDNQYLYGKQKKSEYGILRYLGIKNFKSLKISYLEIQEKKSKLSASNRKIVVSYYEKIINSKENVNYF